MTYLLLIVRVDLLDVKIGGSVNASLVSSQVFAVSGMCGSLGWMLFEVETLEGLAVCMHFCSSVLVHVSISELAV